MVAITMTRALERVRGGLIASCQAPMGSPLREHRVMHLLAETVVAAGAVAIRAEGLADIGDIRAKVQVPIIGLVKRQDPGSAVYITPQVRDVLDLVEAGADIVAVDYTLRSRASGQTSSEFLAEVLAVSPVPILADVDSLSAGEDAWRHGVHAVATTLSGYTEASQRRDAAPDIRLIKELVSTISIPVIGEGRFSSPEHVRAAMDAGAWAVCVGAALTDPWTMTKRFVAATSQTDD